MLSKPKKVQNRYVEIDCFFFSSRRRHTRLQGDWSSDVCSSDLSLGERLERVFPRMVRVMDDAGVIVVMDRIRVNEKGIIEGSGPAAERVQRVFDEFIREKGLKVA